MTALENYALSDLYAGHDGPVFLTGVQALARIPIAQLRADRARGYNTAAFLSGYPGSPLGRIGLEFAKAIEHAPDLPILGRPAVNEELGVTAVMGSQLVSTRADARYEGVLGIWYGNGSGLARAGDALRRANLTGTGRYGGAVAIVGDDPAARGSSLPSSSDATLVDLKMPLFQPGDVQEILDLARHAVMLSRLSGLWTSMKLVAAVADGVGTAELGADRVRSIEPNMMVDGLLHTMVVDGSNTSSSMAREREMQEVRLEIARRYGVVNDLNRPTANPRRGWIGLAAGGYIYREVLEALRRLGLDSIEAIEAVGIRLLRLQMPFPLDRRVIRNFARGLDEVVVIEEKTPSIESMIKAALYGSDIDPRVVGKSDETGATLIPAYGALTADELIPALHRRLADRLGHRLASPPEPEQAERPLPIGIGRSVDGDRVGDAVDSTCMGTEGSQWIGMEPFLDHHHLMQDMSDAALFHSGWLAIRSAVSAGSNITFKLLHTGTAAMTGAQGPVGGLGVREVARILLTMGVTEVLVTTHDPSAYDDADLPTSRYAGKAKVWDRTRLVEAQNYLATVPGVSVLLNDRAGVAETRRQRKRRRPDKPRPKLVINHRICEACGDCGDIANHLSLRTIETPFGPKTAIDQTSHDLDHSRIEGDCPSFMTVEPSARSVRGGSEAPGASGEGSGVGHRSDDPPPDPAWAVPSDRVDLRLAGLGASGVVGAAQILGIAAMLDGWTVRGLDHSRGSQNAGPTVSDIRLTRGEPAPSNLIGRGEADAIIALDLMVAGSEHVLNAGSANRTVLISSTTETPTGEMIGGRSTADPSPVELRQRVATATASERNRFVDAGAVTRNTFGNEATANVFMLGVAFQSGVVPVAQAALERAIELSGDAVADNLAAFRLGRRCAEDAAGGPGPDEGEEAGFAFGSDPDEPPGFDPTLGVPDDPTAGLPELLSKQLVDLRLQPRLFDLLARLTADLVAYQNEAYAERFIDFMTRTVGVERLVDPDSTVLSSTVGRALHKLMAYKDEYEVARLLLGPEARAAVAEVGGEGANVTWKLHPPLLRSLGLSRKLAISAGRARLFMALLAKLRWMRGTAIDPCGGTELRRAERLLIGEYTGALEPALQALGPDNFDATVEFAASALEVRGYERLKLERIADFRTRLQRGVSTGMASNSA